MHLFAAALQDACNSDVNVDVTATPACSHGLTPNQGMAHSQGLAPSQGMGPRQGIAAIGEPQSISHDDCMNTVSLVPELTGIRNHKHPRNCWCCLAGHIVIRLHRGGWVGGWVCGWAPGVGGWVGG